MMIFKKLSNNNLKSVDLWQRPKSENFDFDLISYYFINKDHSADFQTFNSQTISDVDFCDLFEFLDRTNSKIGQQYLFNKLLTTKTISKFEEQEFLITYFTENESVRIKAQALLSKLNKHESYYIANLFLDGYVSKPKWFWAIRLLSILGIVSVALTFLFNKVFILFLFLFITNMIIHFWNKKNIFVYMDSIPKLPALCKIANDLTKLITRKESVESIHTAIKSIGKLQKELSLFKFEAKNRSEFEALILLVWEIIKIAFLMEPLMVFSVLKKLDARRCDIQTLFEYIGKIDSALSVAALRNSITYHCKPAVVSDNFQVLEFADIYHPLIPDCVPNSLKIKDKSILLTGSNMAGKTTFIRTVAINVLLAQTINTCFAKDFKLSPMRLFSAIRISDDLLNDKSYYFEEVLTVKNMINESRATSNNLFLLDEIFKGTNTIERIAAGKAVLSYLAQSDKNIVFVSTHDIELIDLLNEEYDLYHFTELIQDGQIYFDYKLKPGYLSTKNAIRILEINDYPQTVITEANKISNLLH